MSKSTSNTITMNYKGRTISMTVTDDGYKFSDGKGFIVEKSLRQATLKVTGLNRLGKSVERFWSDHQTTKKTPAKKLPQRRLPQRRLQPSRLARLGPRQQPKPPRVKRQEKDAEESNAEGRGCGPCNAPIIAQGGNRWSQVQIKRRGSTEYVNDNYKRSKKTGEQ